MYCKICSCVLKSVSVCNYYNLRYNPACIWDETSEWPNEHWHKILIPFLPKERDFIYWRFPNGQIFLLTLDPFVNFESFFLPKPNLCKQIFFSNFQQGFRIILNWFFPIRLISQNFNLESRPMTTIMLWSHVSKCLWLVMLWLSFEDINFPLNQHFFRLRGTIWFFDK